MISGIKDGIINAVVRQGTKLKPDWILIAAVWRDNHRWNDEAMWIDSL